VGRLLGVRRDHEAADQIAAGGDREEEQAEATISTNHPEA